MSKYCFTFFVYKYSESGKIKMQYGLTEVKEEETCFKSLTSEETFEKGRKVKFKNNSLIISKKEIDHRKKKIYYRFIYETDSDLEKAEKEFLPIADKYVSSKVFGLKRLKKFMHNRVLSMLK